LQDKPRGLLRVTVGPNSSFLSEIIAGFMARNPEVQLEVLSTGRTVDLVEERFDVAIRAGALADSSLVARRLGSVSWFLVATPAYLKKQRRPRAPDDLVEHACLLFGTGATEVELVLHQGERTTRVTVSARLLVSDFDIVYAGAMAGLGIGLLPAFRCIDDLRARRLEHVLPEWAPPSIPVHVVYPTARHLSAKVKAFVEYLHQRMTPPPWELGPLP
jgi:DNA-binding transcriptional LysR family regulator